MKNYDYHSLFYYHILTPLQSIVDSKGNLLTTTTPPKGSPEFRIAYPARETSYAHNYEREEFLANRDKLIIGRLNKESDMVVLLQISRHEDQIVVYKKALRHLFKSNLAVARRELLGLLEKFYQIELGESYESSYVEPEGSYGGRQIHVNTFVGSPRETTTVDSTDELVNIATHWPTYQSVRTMPQYTEVMNVVDMEF